jgi:hypothetical protein
MIFFLGAILAILPIFSFSGQFFWALVADKWLTQARVLTLSSFLSALSVCPLMLITKPSFSLISTVLMSCSFIGAVGPILDAFNVKMMMMMTELNVDGNVDGENKQLGEEKASITSTTTTSSSAAAATVVDSHSLPALSSTAHTSTKSSSLPSSYGKQRMWASIGWGCMSLITGMMIDVFGVLFMFVGYIIGMMMFAIIAGLIIKPKETEIMMKIEMMAIMKKKAAGAVGAADHLPSSSSEGQSVITGSTSNHRLVSPTRAVNFRYLFSLFFGSSIMMIFFFNLFIQGLNMSLVENYLFVYLRLGGSWSDGPAPNSLLGIAVFTTCAAEAPMFYYSDQVLSWLGPVYSYTASHIALSIRFLFYFLIRGTSPWLVLIVEPLHSLTYGLMWANTVMMVNKIAPSGYPTTMLSLSGGVYGQMGQSIGGFSWGALWPRIGNGDGSSCYLIGSGVMMIWAMIYKIGIGYVNRSSSKKLIVVEVEQQQEKKMIAISNDECSGGGADVHSSESMDQADFSVSAKIEVIDSYRHHNQKNNDDDDPYSPV